MKQDKGKTSLASFFRLIYCLAYSSILTFSSETSFDFQRTARHCIQEFLITTSVRTSNPILVYEQGKAIAKTQDGTGLHAKFVG
jgi:hypothetical protein